MKPDIRAALWGLLPLPSQSSAFSSPGATPLQVIQDFFYFIFFFPQCPGLMWGATSFNSYPFPLLERHKSSGLVGESISHNISFRS